MVCVCVCVRACVGWDVVFVGCCVVVLCCAKSFAVRQPRVFANSSPSRFARYLSTCLRAAYFNEARYASCEKSRSFIMFLLDWVTQRRISILHLVYRPGVGGGQRLLKDEPFGQMASTKKQIRIHTPHFEQSKLLSPRFRLVRMGVVYQVHHFHHCIGLCSFKLSRKG